MKQSLLWVLCLAGAAALGISPLGAQIPEDGNGEAEIHSGVFGRRSGTLTEHLPPILAPLRKHLPPELLPPGVRRRVPQDYSTIQAAINASVDGDTVLVSEGTYQENIRYQGKAITVGSLYLIDGDTTHVEATIIDGSMHTHPDSGSVVYFIDGEDTTSVLYGMTIRGGTGTATLYLGIPYREGGGIFIGGGGAHIEASVITRNRIYSENAAGGGISATSFATELPLLVLQGNSISDNHIQGWGTIHGSAGAGVAAAGTNIRIRNNSFERDTVVAPRYASAGGMVIQAVDSAHTYPQGEISGNVFRHNVTQASTHGAVGTGLYAAWTHELTIEGNVFESNVATSITGWAQGGGLIVDDYRAANTVTWKRITRNRFLGNSVSHGGSSTLSGAGMLLFYTRAHVEANTFAGNSASAAGGGAALYHSAYTLKNNIITGNSSGTSGGGVLLSYGVGLNQPVLHNTIVGNSAGYRGGGLVASGSGTSGEVLNNVVWGNTASLDPQIYAPPGTARVNYSDVEGGWAGTGNINADPLFAAGGFDLAMGSPCLGAGRDTITALPATDYYGNPRPNPAGSHPDMGACESARANAALTVRRVPQNYLTIQAAIDAAVAGDTVLVDHGTYFENILINKDRILVASRYVIDSDTAHIDSTIINGSTPHHADSGATVSFGVLAETTSVITGFTITGGTGNSDTYAPYPWPGTIRQGGGVLIEERGTVRRNHITGNTILPAGGDVGAYGAGIGVSSFSNSTAIIENNIISRNFIRLSTGDRDVAGGGILMSGNGRIVGNVITEDTISCAGGGGGSAGIYIGDCTSALVADNLIAHNHCEVTGTAVNHVTGGGISSRRGSVTIVGNRIHGNTLAAGGTDYGARGGGIDIRNDDDTVLVVISGNQIDSNTATSSMSYGGGIFVYNSRVRLANNLIADNRATRGGGVMFSTVSLAHRPSILNCTITGNTALEFGGAMFGTSVNPMVMNSILYNNSAASNPEIYGTATVVYSDVQGGFAGTGNIDAPPEFAAGEFSLGDTSPCIGTGIDSMNISGTWYVAPDHCMMGSLRPTPGWSMPDMGACESGLASAFAHMVCSPDELDAFAPSSDSTTATLTMTNYGGTPLLWSITVTPPAPGELSWISVDPASGSTLPGAATPVTVTMRAVQPAGSVQTGALEISSNDTVSGPRTLPVRLSVLQIATVGFEPAWNILSVPVIVQDFRSVALFPTSTAGAFRYLPGSGYLDADTLAHGAGYWLKFPASGSSVLGGFPIPVDTIPVLSGWNLIGSITIPVPATSVGSIPGGIITSQFVGYSPAGYVTCTTIELGKGYWVKMGQSGSLVLGSPAAGLIRIVPTSEQPPAAPGEIAALCASELPTEYALGQNYPNPFNPVTTIAFAIPSGVLDGTGAAVSLRIYDVLGRHVTTLVDDIRQPGFYTVSFDASRLASGMYLYRLTAGGFTATRRMMLVK